MAKRILLTGGSGFLGQYLVERLLNGGYEVTCILRRKSSRVCKGVNIVYADIQKEIPQSAFSGISIVIHAASESHLPDWKTNYMTNVIGTKNIIKACKNNKIRKLIYISSINVKMRNKGSYGKTKKMAEICVRKSGLDFVVIRPSMIYGAGDSNLSKTISIVKAFPIVPIIGSGNALMQPVYVEDVVEAVSQCLKQDVRKKIYNIVGPESFTFNEYIDMILQQIGKKKSKLHIPFIFAKLCAMLLEKVCKSPPITMEQVYSMSQGQKFDIKVETKELGYKPKRFETVMRGLI